jgi:2-dehydro-3-deoxygluconokinase
MRCEASGNRITRSGTAQATIRRLLTLEHGMSTHDGGPAWDVVSIGEPMVEFSALPGEPGRYLQGFGGDTMNAVIAAARQGARVSYVTRLGEDDFGRMLRELWQREGVDASSVAVDPVAPTGLYFIHHGPDGHRFSYRRAGSAASLMRPEHLPKALIANARYLHTSAITQAIAVGACDAVFEAISHARQCGVAVVYDPNLRLNLWPLARARAVIAATAAQADCFLPSLDDARLLSGLEVPEDILAWARDLGAREVVLKLGAGGVLAWDGTHTRRLPGHVIDLVDATGAGDCFAGCFMAQRTRGEGFWNSLAFANAAAALACGRYGAVASYPARQEVEAFLMKQVG